MIFLLMAGCEDRGPQLQFGAPYEFIVNELGSSPDTPPRINGHWLLVTVSYSGGCADHEFLLESYARRDTAHVWLNHISNDDTCDAEILDDLSIELPSGVRDMRIIAMHDPLGGDPHLLKW